MRFDSHMHTPLCGHAFGEPTEYVEAAARSRLDRITFTCHMPIDDPALGGGRMRMAESDLPRYLKRVEKARAHGEKLGVEVLLGIEAEIFPDPKVTDRVREIVGRVPFDFVLGSMHHHTPAYQQRIDRAGLRGNDAAIIEGYFEALAEAPATGIYHSIAHPDVIRLYGTIDGPFEPEKHEDVIRAAIQAAIDHDVCWEINTSGRIKGDFVEHPDPIIRRWGIEMGLGFTLGSDAHLPQAVGQHFHTVLADARADGLIALSSFRGGRAERIALEA